MLRVIEYAQFTSLVVSVFTESIEQLPCKNTCLKLIISRFCQVLNAWFMRSLSRPRRVYKVSVKTKMSV